jgi:hypothetical protein
VSSSTHVTVPYDLDKPVSMFAPAALEWSLAAVLLVSSMMPWYALRVFPIVALKGGTLNVLDGLTAVATVLTIPSVIAGLRGGVSALWWVCAFLAYLAVPFAVGVSNPATAFLAWREARPLAMYALALAFTVSPGEPGRFHRLCTVYVAGTLIAVFAVAAHLGWHVPLPGYPRTVAQTWGAGNIIYLDWTVPLIAFLLSLTNLLTARPGPARAAWAGATAVVTWYALNMGERFVEFLFVGLALTVTSLPPFGGGKPWRLAVIAVVMAYVLAVGTGMVGGPVWISGPSHYAVWHWSRTLSDDSLHFRLQELAEGFPRFLHHPLEGEGLGGLIIAVNPRSHGGSWPYISSGYGYLLVKTGLLGFLFFVGAAVMAVRQGLGQVRTGVNRDGAWPAALVALLGIGTLLALNLLYTAADTPEGVIAFSLFYGMILGYRHEAASTSHGS